MPRLLTMWFVYLTDKLFTNPKLSLINVPALNYLLRSEIFVNNRQLRVVHLILDFEPISRSFLDVGNSIRAGNHCLARIDVSRPDFLAPYDLPPVNHPIPQGIPPVAQPLQQVPLGEAIIGEGTTSSSSLEQEIDKFQFEKKNNSYIGGRRGGRRAFVCADSCPSGNLHCRHIRRGGNNGPQDRSKPEGVGEE